MQIELENAPIVSTYLRNGLIPELAEALNLIDKSERTMKGDAAWGLGATAIGIASSCGILALSGVGPVMAIPAIACFGCVTAAWNSRQTEIDRVRESEFLLQFPQVLELVEAKADGTNDRRVADAYDQTFKSYRYGDLEDLGRFLSGSAPTKLQNIQIYDSPIVAYNEPIPDVPRTQSVQSVAAYNEPIPDAPEPAKMGTPAFIAEMSHAVKSSLIVGIPGSGKDLTIAYLLSEVKRRRPDLTLYGIDPKNDPKETGYYRNFDADKLDRFKAAKLNPFEIQERLDRSLDLVLDQDDALLFINEFATLAGFCDGKWMQRFNSKLQAVAQMGDSENRYIWIASQTGNLGELKMQSSLRSTLGANMLAIVKPGSDAAIAGLTKTDLISGHDEQRMRAMIDRSPVGRAYYYSRAAQWAAMPELPNLSGYDRDTRQWMPGCTPPEPPSDPTEFDVSAVESALGINAWSAEAPKQKPRLKMPATHV